MIYIVKQGENQNYERGITAVIFTLFLTVARSVQSRYHFRQTESSFFSSLAEFSQCIAWTKHKAYCTRSWKSFSQYISWINTKLIWPHLLKLSIIRRKEKQGVFKITVMVIWVITITTGWQNKKILWRMHVQGFTWQREEKESRGIEPSAAASDGWQCPITYYCNLFSKDYHLRANTCPYFLAVLFRWISSCKKEYILL